MGISVIAGKDEAGNVSCSLEIELPEIKELIGDFVERSPVMTYGNARIILAVGYSCWLAY